MTNFEGAGRGYLVLVLTHWILKRKKKLQFIHYRLFAKHCANTLKYVYSTILLKQPCIIKAVPYNSQLFQNTHTVHAQSLTTGQNGTMRGEFGDSRH